jgi:hypothetical protein
MTSGSDGADGGPTLEPRMGSVLPALAPNPGLERSDRANNRPGPEPWTEGSGDADGYVAPELKEGGLWLAYLSSS